MCLVRNVGERAIVVVVVETRPVAFRVSFVTHVLTHDVWYCRPIAGNENIWPTVIVIVEEPTREAHVGLRNSCLFCHVNEFRDFSLRSYVTEKMIRSPHH